MPLRESSEKLGPAALAGHGARAVYVNFQFRVAIIALWTGILNVADPFRKAG